MSSVLSQYLIDVLGIRGFVPSLRPHVLFVMDHALSSPAQALFDKMASAMKLQTGEFVVRVLTDIEKNSLDQSLFVDLQNSARVVVSFSEKLNALSFKPQQSQWIATESPELLVTRQELKRKVWADLQVAMSQIAIVE